MTANYIYIIGQSERITSIPAKGKKNAHPLFDWKILKTDHVRPAVYAFVCNLDGGNDTKLANRLAPYFKEKYHS